MATLNPSQTHPQNLTTTSPASSVPQPPNPLNLAAAAAMAVTSTNTSTSTSNNPSQHPTEPHQTHHHHHQQHLDPSNHTDTYPHQITGSGGPTATAPFLRDFSLVAEAAKRAQMSVMVRDLESVTL